MTTPDTSREAVERLIEYYRDGGYCVEEISATLRALLDRAERFEKLDREAATYVETVICMRTGFTGEQPYVGWKGLGLALTEALDERDALRTKLEAADAIKSALDERDMFANPYMFEQAADEIDCEPHSCCHYSHEWDTNVGACKKSEAGDYCPNDLAETLRAVGRVAKTFACPLPTLPEAPHD